MMLYYTFDIMQLPSNKVGLVLIVVVLVCAGTVFSSKIQVRKQVKDLQNVELVIGRDANSQFKSGDDDQDGLTDWLEEFYHSDPQNTDTDGDGTNDGAEVEVDRDPTIAGPNDPLITRKDLIKTEVGSSTPGTITDKASIELFSQYLMLKQKGTLKPEDEAKLVADLSQKVASEASLKDKYTTGDLNVSESTKETITIYGDRVAQATLDLYIEMDSYKHLSESIYLLKIANTYKTYAESLKQIRVPTVTQDIHLKLMNYSYKTSKLFEVLGGSNSDPMTILVIIGQFKASQISDVQLYTTLSEYFKNNDILFDTESTIRFWYNFAN